MRHITAADRSPKGQDEESDGDCSQLCPAGDFKERAEIQQSQERVLELFIFLNHNASCVSFLEWP